MSEEKFSKCEEGGKKKKKCKCRISDVRKKRKWKLKEKFRKKKVKILLSSCSLVGRKGFRCSGGEKVKVKKNVWVVGYPVSWVPCCETWLKFEIEALRCKKKVKIKKKIVRVVGCALHTLGRHVVNEPKVGCHCYNELEIS